MKKIIINGNKLLKGTIRVSGAKNAAVALIPASILTDDEVTICNVPDISDVDALENILKYLNVSISRATESVVISSKGIKNCNIPEEITKKLRASYYFMGALLARFKHVEMYFPGGCGIGARPINYHLEGFKKFGATVIQDGDKYIIDAKKLVGANIKLERPSVGATINLMMVATKAYGKTIIENAAKEPEICNVATLLRSMGANIEGDGTSIIKIVGVDKLHSGFVQVMSDRIEAGTYTIIGELLGCSINITNIIPEHLKALTDELYKCGSSIEILDDAFICNKSSKIVSTNIVTSEFPGFPTDLQQPFSTYLTQCDGISRVIENLYENRFMQVQYLNKMGAKIDLNNNEIIIAGKTKLKGTEVTATDLRAGAALIIAGLVAEGKTTINDAEHILRGYDGLITKLKDVGADIELVDE